MDTDDERVMAIARVLIDDGYIDDEHTAEQAAARILEIVQTQLPTETSDAARTGAPGTA